MGERSVMLNKQNMMACVGISIGSVSDEVATGGETLSIVQHQIGRHFCPYREFSVVVDQFHFSEFIHHFPVTAQASGGHEPAVSHCGEKLIATILFEVDIAGQQ
jgi:hypothetical protein